LAPVAAIATRASPVTAMVAALKHLCRYAIIATSLIAATGCEGTHAPPSVASRAPPDPAAVRRGEYLAVAANCAACHTGDTPGAAPFAGGRNIPTPFGNYYSGNITPTRRPGSAPGAMTTSCARCGTAYRRAARTTSRPSRSPRSL